jgi:hypothetical protein
MFIALRSARVAFIGVPLLVCLSMSAACVGAPRPVYRAADVVNIAAQGAYRVTTYGDIDAPKLPDELWHIRASPFTVDGVEKPGFRAEILDTEGKSATLSVVFFKVGETLYADTSVLRAPVNEIASMHLAPLHTVSRVVKTDDTLAFHPLIDDWMKKNARALKPIDMGEFVVLTADSSAWRTFLSSKTAHAGFAEKPLIVLQREK